MKITLRHFVAIGLTTALAFGLFKYWFEEQMHFRPGHPTTFDMVWYLLATFFGSLGVISLVIFPIVTTVGRLSGKWRVARAVCILALPAVIPVILFLLLTIFDGNNQLTGGFKFPFLELALYFTFAASILFCVLFYVYCGVVWFERFISREQKNGANKTPSAV
jgi:hypothetical protein